MDSKPNDDAQGFSEPSDEVKRRNRVTGYVFLAIVLGLIALAMITRAYGG
ncbi:MAG: hypothetical protein ACOC9J_00080 [Persicimonas sp.]